MAVAVKVCGITNEAALDAALEADVAWIGFVFFPPSPRFVRPERAASLAARGRGGPLRVGLFVDPSESTIDEVLAQIALDALQIYATPARLAFLRERFRRPIWRAVGVATADDLPREGEGYDAFVIEAKPPPEASRPGGNGRRLDWAMLAGWRAPAPWLLAGGLNAENVAQAIAASGARAVDVSSGVERRRGEKDPELIRAFVRTARAALESPTPSRRYAPQVSQRAAAWHREGRPAGS